MSDLLCEANEFYDEMVNWRRTLHQIPELGTDLPQTISYVCSQLDKMHIDYTVLEDCSCIIAMIGKGDKCFLLRSDMDALPVTEEADVDFRSVNGHMHACGHDLHTATLLGAARLLKAHEHELGGVVKLLFQSGEETFEGAATALEHGILENPHVDAAFAMHFWANQPVKRLLYSEYVMASVYAFKITLTGHGGHGSEPENCIDPINAGVEIYHALQSLIARECPPSEKAALTIGQFTAGDAANVIPETAVLKGTLRTYKQETRKHLSHRIDEIVLAVGNAYRCKVEIEVLGDMPSIKNDMDLSRKFIQSIRELDALDEIVDDFQLMCSEDFSLISEQVPSGYFILGAGVEDASKRLGQHNPKVIFNEDSLPVGAAVYAKCAIDYFTFS